MNHISTVRQHLLDQMAALRAASGVEAIKQELDKAKGISELAQVAVNTAKVEVDYLIATEQTSTPFLEVPPDEPYVRQDGLPNGISSITRHRLQG
ncbi:hypothetical protein [Variovorax sp.]|jgi:hypothetical protein|uniref:hypothetical protein n=1 Tax=Variovorax sp. TaxID=1871043 RepID=UPI004037956E